MSQPDNKKTFQNRNELIKLIDETLKEINHEDIFLIGSLSAFLYCEDKELHSSLRTTQDIDLVQRKDSLIGEPLTDFIHNYGEDSDFETQNKVYAEFVTAALIEDGAIGWEDRMKTIKLPSGKKIQCLNPIDAATNKLTAHRVDKKDVIWITAALKANLFTQSDLTRNLKNIVFQMPINEIKVRDLKKEFQKQDLKLSSELDKAIKDFGQKNVWDRTKNRILSALVNTSKEQIEFLKESSIMSMKHGELSASNFMSVKDLLKEVGKQHTPQKIESIKASLESMKIVKKNKTRNQSREI